MKRKNKRGSIFGKLIGSYFLFAAVAVITVLVYGVVQLLAFSGGDIDQMNPGALVAEDGTLGSLDVVYRCGGWVECLDEQYRVTRVFGEKQTPQQGYTERELLEATALKNEGNDYWVFWESYDKGSYLFVFPTEAMKLTFTFELEASDMEGAGNAMLAAMVLMLIAEGVLVSLYIYWKIKKPLKQTVEGMQKVTLGKQRVHLSFRAEGEFTEIQDAFNLMIDRLEAEQSEKEKLQKDRQQMLLELSHDLKTPLATIKSSAAALMEGVVAEEEKARYYQTIAAKSDRVNTMADDMFTMLKMESSDYKPTLIRMDFCELVRQICVEHYEEMEQADFSVQIEIPEEPIWVLADEKLLARVAANFITNAVKYNKTGKEISVTVKRERDEAVLVVADDGTRIEESVQQSMFLAFVRGDASRSTSGGTGLGLAIAGGIARKHGGEVGYLYEQGENKFFLRLPCAENT
ncbi:MAG: HAMP domain-containing histidine kinase [Roseburia sp.]|nr:HAMP domain-containing histidine kinase [Roseburia sp.]